MKEGVVALSRLSGLPITPVAFTARPCWRFGSWDGTLLPLPFARVVCRFGQPLDVPGDAEPEDEEIYRQSLERELNRLTEELDARSGLRPAR